MSDLRTFRQNEAGLVSDHMVSSQIERLKDHCRAMGQHYIGLMEEVEGALRLLVQMVRIVHSYLVYGCRIRLAVVSRYFLLD